MTDVEAAAADEDDEDEEEEEKEEEEEEGGAAAAAAAEATVRATPAPATPSPSSSSSRSRLRYARRAMSPSRSCSDLTSTQNLVVFRQVYQPKTLIKSSSKRGVLRIQTCTPTRAITDVHIVQASHFDAGFAYTIRDVASAGTKCLPPA